MKELIQRIREKLGSKNTLEGEVIACSRLNLGNYCHVDDENGEFLGETTDNDYIGRRIRTPIATSVSIELDNGEKIELIYLGRHLDLGKRKRVKVNLVRGTKPNVYQSITIQPSVHALYRSVSTLRRIKRRIPTDYVEISDIVVLEDGSEIKSRGDLMPGMSHHGYY